MARCAKCLTDPAKVAGGLGAAAESGARLHIEDLRMTNGAPARATFGWPDVRMIVVLKFRTSHPVVLLVVPPVPAKAPAIRSPAWRRGEWR